MNLNLARLHQALRTCGFDPDSETAHADTLPGPLRQRSIAGMVPASLVLRLLEAIKGYREELTSLQQRTSPLDAGEGQTSSQPLSKPEETPRLPPSAFPYW